MKSQEIAGHSITLEAGKAYRASRPMAVGGRYHYPVTITELPENEHIISEDWRPVTARITGLNYDQANALLDAFNNGTMSFDGRVW